MRIVTNINQGWTFHEGFSDKLKSSVVAGAACDLAAQCSGYAVQLF